jgi:hypothetical protein
LFVQTLERTAELLLFVDTGGNCRTVVRRHRRELQNCCCSYRHWR